MYKKPALLATICNLQPILHKSKIFLIINNSWLMRVVRDEKQVALETTSYR